MPDYFGLDQTPLFISAEEDYRRTISNGGPNTIYYGSARTVSSISNDGSIAAGANHNFTDPVWIVSTTGGTRVFVSDPGDDEPNLTEDEAVTGDWSFQGGLDLSSATLTAPASLATQTELDSRISATQSTNMAVTLEAPVNVQHAAYGALGDNSANDTSALQAAYTAAAVAGGEVYVPPGIYRTNSAVSVGNFVSTLTDGADATIIRCTGNHYAFNFNPANRVSIKGLMIDAVSSQSSGGGFDFTNARFNIRIDDVYLGSNLHTGFNIKPNATSGHFWINRVKWNGVVGCTNGVLLGDGTNLVAHVTFTNVLGTLTSATDMTNWWVQKNNTDTIKCRDVNFYTGTNGVLIGENATGSVTDCFWDQCLVDMMTGTGLDVAKCRGFNWTDGQIQTCATGINVGTLSVGFKARGGTVQNNTSDGVTVQSGASHWTFDDVTVSDNNTANGAFGQGFDITGGTSDWAITNCKIGNNILLTSGHQKNGILISAGASTRFRIENNQFSANETAPIDNGATGALQSVRGNLGIVTPTVASAATVTLPGNDLVKISGTADITSITASYPDRRVTLVFTGNAAATGVTDGSNLKLNGNFGYTTDDTLTLLCDGTNWFEQGRSTN